MTLLTSGCSMAEVKRGFLPASSEGATNHTADITHLWNGGWAAAMMIGLVVWGLIIWCLVVYRRRKHETGLPAQLRYSMPIEAFYIAVPLIMVIVFYFFTVKTENSVDKPYKHPDQVIQVYGKQWSWDFNYLTENVYYSGVQVALNGTTAPGKKVPTLYLPANKKIQIKLDSRDVVHSFWVPAFLQKRDIFPGRESSIYLEPLKVGTYAGKCAELCGEYHSEMLFNVKVVPEAQYQQYIQSLKKQGNTGKLGPQYNRNPDLRTPKQEEAGS
ncbi:cytochrome c oxidase subunit 2 [Spelaeicoccus albus]|uniref:cytochrome-c oxidase n=1 Tax=Spelaeicoccus albus TaxID=1280376 RepID=A0A7Z0D3S6_9MICO|nr:cytochrome c oxidase subunit 2 [Spelaeicoccus albus]